MFQQRNYLKLDGWMTWLSYFPGTAGVLLTLYNCMSPNNMIKKQECIEKN